VAADASGGIVASWLSGCRVWVSTTSRGQAWGRPGQLATIAADVPPSWIWEPTLAANSAGIALVAWAAQDRKAGRQLFSSRYRPSAWFVVQRFDGGEAQQLESPYAAALALDGAGSGMAHLDGKQKAVVRDADPTLAVQASTCDDAMQVGMEAQVTGPGVKHGGRPGARRPTARAHRLRRELV
jgi:hypothetical protein